MSTKDIRKFAILSIGAVMTAFGLLPARLSAQVLHLQTGTTMVNSSQATADATAPGLGVDPKVVGNDLTINLTTDTISTFFQKVDRAAHARLFVRFQVDTQPGAPDVSTLPVFISVPVTWKGALQDNSLIPPPPLWHSRFLRRCQWPALSCRGAARNFSTYRANNIGQ